MNIIHKPFQILFDWFGDYTLNINAKTLKQLKRRLCIRSIKRIDGLPNGSNCLGDILSDFRIEQRNKASNEITSIRDCVHRHRAQIYTNIHIGNLNYFRRLAERTNFRNFNLARFELFFVFNL